MHSTLRNTSADRNSTYVDSKVTLLLTANKHGKLRNQAIQKKKEKYVKPSEVFLAIANLLCGSADDNQKYKKIIFSVNRLRFKIYHCLCNLSITSTEMQITARSFTLSGKLIRFGNYKVEERLEKKQLATSPLFFVCVLFSYFI